jgi:alginate O-acetyltransferase complex protein AlgI
MLLGGIWHGASWNFIIWGAAHGTVLAIERFWQIDRGKIEENRAITSLALGWLVTQTIVLLLWIPFRAKTLADSLAVISGIFTWRTMMAEAPVAIPITLLVLPIFCDTVFVRLLRSPPGQPLRRPELRFGLLILCALAVGLVTKTGLRSFIYFQF